tara:strand:+ start:83388 stop:85505 length:2118 start_codon:yes stop_codon:yes gene_type:complete
MQSFTTGITSVVDLPIPQVKDNHLLIRTSCSLISSGTERMLAKFAQSNLIEKAKGQPDKVKEVIEKAKIDGVFPTIEAIRSKLDQPISLGYNNVGNVISVGKGVKGFSIGDRVVSNGPHAEIVLVPSNLCALIPENVENQSAVFTVMSSIGLQSIRLANPTFGETFVVSGLGLIGLLTAQLLKANGCRVLGFDFDSNKCELAKTFGIETLNLSNVIDPVSWCDQKTNFLGVDGVIISAATESSEPVNLAAKICRKRGRIVLLGVTGINLRRDLFYKKELSFQVSCSYGPGRYDDKYEKKGHDYPFAFVRWTEQRNFQAIVQALSKKLLVTEKLISHRFDINDASSAYELLLNGKPSLGILLEYPNKVDLNNKSIQLRPNSRLKYYNNKPILAFIGSGNYACRTLIPAFKKHKALFHTISAPDGLRPLHFGKKYEFMNASTDIQSTIDNEDINTIVIATRHESHCDLVKRSLLAGKNVFVEKPLCINREQFNSLIKLYKDSEISQKQKKLPLLMVGFNRRFSPLVEVIKKHLSNISASKTFIFTCNAGSLPENHWLQDPLIGGGRLIGEACHFVDLIRFLADSKIIDMSIVKSMNSGPVEDTFTIQIKFDNGSIGTVHYFSNGSKSFPKERLEVFADGKIFQIDNFRKLKCWGINGFKNISYLKQNKGQNLCTNSFVQAISSEGKEPIPLDQIFEVHDWLLKLEEK